MIYHILLAFVVTFIITVVLGKIAIPMLRSLHAQQSIREEGPERSSSESRYANNGWCFHDDRPCSWCSYFRTMECGYRHVIVFNIGSLFIGLLMIL